MRTLTLALAAATASLAAATVVLPPALAEARQGAAAPAQSALEREVAGNTARFAAALATGDPDRVTALFAPRAILAPTVSNEVRTTPDRIRAYFVDFLQLSPRPRVDSRTITILDPSTAIEGGTWTFQLTRNGTTSAVQARYTIVWEKTGAGWQIQLLHSSLMPEG